MLEHKEIPWANKTFCLELLEIEVWFAQQLLKIGSKITSQNICREIIEK